VEKEVIYTEEIKLFLRELFVLLYEKEYFGFPDDAKSYVDRITRYAEQFQVLFPGRMHPLILESMVLI
jgi:hypothetical protein